MYMYLHIHIYLHNHKAKFIRYRTYLIYSISISELIQIYVKVLSSESAQARLHITN